MRNFFSVILQILAGLWVGLMALMSIVMISAMKSYKLEDFAVLALFVALAIPGVILLLYARKIYKKTAVEAAVIMAPLAPQEDATREKSDLNIEVGPPPRIETAPNNEIARQ
jgi:hypothetical protein